MSTDEKLCPYCGETIKSIAIKCKHCQSDLSEKNQSEKTEMEQCIFCGEEVEKNCDKCKHCDSNLPANNTYKSILVKNNTGNTEINFKFNPKAKFSITCTSWDYGEKVTTLNLNKCLNSMQVGELTIEDSDGLNSICISRKDNEFFKLRLFVDNNSGLYKIELNREQVVLVSEYFMKNDVRFFAGFDWMPINESVSGLLSEATSILLTPKRKKLLVIYLLWFFVLLGLYLFRQYRGG